jgi:RNA polymerase sigma factor (TIGR02999 family)
MDSETKPGQVTQLLLAWGDGDRSAYERLVPLVYGELHEMARRYLRRERPDHTLQPTALVHEAYLRLVDQSSARWSNRTQFFGIAAQAMRRILVDHARGRAARKRGGDVVRVALGEPEGPTSQGEAFAVTVPRDVELIDLDDALRELTALDPHLVRVVELRYFAGLTIEETAEVLDVSPATVKRDWVAARAWLFQRLRGVRT